MIRQKLWRMKPYVPPVVWSRLRRWAGVGEEAREVTTPGSDITALTSVDSFSVPFRRVSLPLGRFFVPEYAVQRPAARAILAGNLYEPMTHKLVHELLRVRPGNLVHAGTFFGDMLPSFSRACPGVVYAFEPVLENYVLAKLGVQDNRLDNVILLNAALSSEIAVGRIDTGDQNGKHLGGGSRLGERGQFTTLVTIDSFQIPDLSVIQLDVEGHELEALRGATETIKRASPIVLIEDNNNNCESYLKYMDYSLSGQIPGLYVWTSKQDRTDIKSILKRL